jgi:hypothetical protein
MSGSGQNRKSSYEHMFSALRLKADITLRTRYVRFVPEPEVAAHSITSSARPSIVDGISNPSALAVFTVDNQFELCRKLDRQIGSFGASSAPIVGGQKCRLW